MRPQYPQTPMSEEDRKLAAATEELARSQQVAFHKAVLMIELRKWCVVQAVDVCGKAGTLVGVRDLAEGFFEFVSEPIKE